MENKELKQAAFAGVALVLGLPLLKRLSDSQRQRMAEAEEKKRETYNVNCITGFGANVNCVTFGVIV